MIEREFQKAFKILSSSAPDNWTELKVVFQIEGNIQQNITYYKSKASDIWIREHYCGFELMDFFDEVKNKIPDKDWSKLQLTFDSDGNLEYQILDGDPEIFKN